MTRVGQILRKQFIDDLTADLVGHSNAFLLSYSRMNGNAIGDLRKNLQKAGAKMLVSKNRIAGIVLNNIGKEDLVNRIGEQTAFVVSSKDSVEISKILVNYAKDRDVLTIKGGILEGRVLTQADVIRLSELPPREVLQSQLLAMIQAPVSRLMAAMNAKTRDVLSILKQYSEKKGGN
jgi:large subunit ribosomal protein L10